MRDRTTTKKPDINVKLDRPGGNSHLKPIGGSNSDKVNGWLANLATNALHLPDNLTLQEREQKLSQCVQLMVGLNPSDEIEGMLAAQLAATNAAALEMMRRAWIADLSFDVRMSYLAMSNKLSRTHAVLTETLLRKRSGGQQKIIVERVQVAPGGQAVLGDVHQSLGGGGAQEKVNQSHEHATETGRITPPSESPMPCPIETYEAKMRSASRTG